MCLPLSHYINLVSKHAPAEPAQSFKWEPVCTASQLSVMTAFPTPGKHLSQSFRCHKNELQEAFRHTDSIWEGSGLPVRCWEHLMDFLFGVWIAISIRFACWNGRASALSLRKIQQGWLSISYSKVHVVNPKLSINNSLFAHSRHESTQVFLWIFFNVILTTVYF